MGVFLTVLITFFGTSGLFIFVVFYVYTHPEKLDKWIGMGASLLAKCSRKYDEVATKHEIQGKLNSFAKDLSEVSDLKPTKLKVRWTESQDEIQLEEGEVVLVLRDRGYRNRNFVHASYLYTSTMLLRELKHHISQKQAASLDIFTTQKIIRKENKDAMHIFMKDIFNPLIKDKKIKDLIEQFVEIDKSGYYSQILLKELNYLGSKGFLTVPRETIIKEVRDLISFLHQFAKREVGDDSINDTFVGLYMKCSIKIVSTQMVRLLDKVQTPITRILKSFDKGIENVYVIGPAHEEASTFIEKVCEGVCEQRDTVERVETKTMAGQITKNQTKQAVDTYYVHLRDLSSTEHIIP